MKNKVVLAFTLVPSREDSRLLDDINADFCFRLSAPAGRYQPPVATAKLTGKKWRGGVNCSELLRRCVRLQQRRP